MKYHVKTFRDAGLQSHWTKTRNGCPIIACRKDDKSSWYVVDGRMWKAMKVDGVVPAFESFTLLGDIFSITA